MIHISFPLDKQSFDIQFMRVWIHQRMINWVIKKEQSGFGVRSLESILNSYQLFKELVDQFINEAVGQN